MAMKRKNNPRQRLRNVGVTTDIRRANQKLTKKLGSPSLIYSGTTVLYAIAEIQRTVTTYLEYFRSLTNQKTIPVTYTLSILKEISYMLRSTDQFILRTSTILTKPKRNTSKLKNA